tara:strand:- start:5337 stop:7046 length:1710 start_codon:yes stop_codon:yes gene_type:complete
VVLDDPPGEMAAPESAQAEVTQNAKTAPAPTTAPTPVTTTTSAAAGTKPSTESAFESFTVEVGAAEKVGDGMSAFAAYPVLTETSTTKRRFSDFTKLRRTLQKTHPGCIVHPLPDKVVTTSPFNAEFLEQRRKGLDKFMTEITAHPVLKKSEHLAVFLTPMESGDVNGDATDTHDNNGDGVNSTASSDPSHSRNPSAPGTPSKTGGQSPLGSVATDEAWYQKGAAGTALSAVDGWFKQVTASAESFVHGASPDTVLMEEEPSYLEASEYLLKLEERLKRATRASDEVVSSINSGGLIVGNFGENAVLLGDCEERGAKMLLGETAGGLGQAFRQVGAAAISTRAAHELNAEKLANEFRAPLRDALELVKAAKEAVDLRSEALLKVQTTRAQAEKKRVKLEQALEKNSTGDGSTVGSTDGTSTGDAPPAQPSNGGWFEKLASSTTKALTRPQETTEDLQKDLSNAEAAKEQAKERYDTIKATMQQELPRVHRQLEGILNAAFFCAQRRFTELARSQAAAWEAVMPGCADVEALDPPPMPTPAEGVGAAIARSLAGVMGTGSPAISPEEQKA